MSKVWLNGRILPAAEAKVPVLDRGLLSGYGLFETLRAYGGRPWALSDHCQRLHRGAELIGLVVPEAESMAEAMTSVLEANDLTEAGVRVTVTAGEGPADPADDPIGDPSVIVISWPLRDYSDLYEKGASLVTLSEGGRPLAGVKTTSYAVSVAGRRFAHRAGADDTLFLGGHKRVLEATGSNIFAISGSELRTPPLDEAILPGVTRRYLLDLAGDLGYSVKEEAVYVDDLLGADEVVLTSSLREVYPASSLDGQALGRAGVAERLRAEYRALVLRELGLG